MLLIIEDETILRGVLQETFEVFGLTNNTNLLVAANLAEARNFLQQHGGKITHILSDNDLPDGQGADFLGSFAIEFSPSARRILHTAAAKPANLQADIEFVSKNSDRLAFFRELANSVKNPLGNLRTSHENQTSAPSF